MLSKSLTCCVYIATHGTRVSMCGRSACSRDATRVRHACAYRPRGSKKAVKPPLMSCNSQQYYPSYNVSPQTNTPVLLSSQHNHIKKTFNDQSASTCVDDLSVDRVLQVMKWGLVPSWHKGEAKSFPTLLNNCRFEGMMEKASFRNAVQKRQRCIVLADGFFEWDRKGSHKQPYFIYFTDSAPSTEMKEVLMEDEDECSSEAGVKSERVGTTSGGESSVISGRLLTMAGLFDIWRNEETGEPLFTYTIITVDAHPNFAHIHDRMPAVLDGDEAIEMWLDPSLSTREVSKLIHPTDCLTWYPVSTVVNNVRNKTPECVTRIDPLKQISSKQNTLHKWFSKSPKKKQASDETRDEAAEPQTKKLKIESEQ